MAKRVYENYRFQQYIYIEYLNVNFVNRFFQVYIFIFIFIDYIRDYNKRIEIFKLNKPVDGHYLVLEVIGMPSGKTF